MRALPKWTPRASVLLAAVAGLAVMPATALAGPATFSYTGGEQTYTVPAGITTLYITTTGAAGGGPTSGTSLVPGRGAIVAGKVAVTPGHTLYVEVGGVGGNSQGGFNGGGNGGDVGYLSAFGGGGASDVRTLARADAGSLASRLIVGAGGGGSADPAARGGNAGQDGQGFEDPAAGGGAGAADHGGAGGCTSLNVGCGSAGMLGRGGSGGASGSGAQTRVGSGGGGGLYGGGGGAGVSDGNVGGGGGGSSLVPPGGSAFLAGFTQPAGIVISTKIPKYTAYEIPVYLCFDASPEVRAGTVVANVSYLDKGAGDVRLEDAPGTAVPTAAGSSFTATLNGVPYATYTLDAFGLRPIVELKGNDVPAIGTTPVADIRFSDPPPPGLPSGFVVASSTCNPATP